MFLITRPVEKLRDELLFCFFFFYNKNLKKIKQGHNFFLQEDGEQIQTNCKQTDDGRCPPATLPPTHPLCLSGASLCFYTSLVGQRGEEELCSVSRLDSCCITPTPPPALHTHTHTLFIYGHSSL